MPVRPGNGVAESLDWSRQISGLHLNGSERKRLIASSARLYECVPNMRDKQQKAAWLARFDYPMPLSDGGLIEALEWRARPHVDVLRAGAARWSLAGGGNVCAARR